jgi:uncharacterized phage protein (TIGR02218 family)
VKTIPAGLATHIAAGSNTLATALRITRVDNAVYAFTSHDSDAVISGVTYRADPGLQVTDIVVAANAAVGNLDLVTLHDGTTFTNAEILGGLWRNAAFYLFRYNHRNIAAGTYPILAGTLGEVEIFENLLKVELRDLRQYLQQAVGSVSSKTCRYRLGDAKCTKDITVPPFTVTGTVTAVVNSLQIFSDTGRAEVADYFGEGEVRWILGNNAGLSSKVKTFTAPTFELALPMFRAIEIGDTYTAVVGCRKRREEDCRDKFDNVLNFGGEPDRKGLNDLVAPPDV